MAVIGELVYVAHSWYHSFNFHYGRETLEVGSKPCNWILKRYNCTVDVVTCTCDHCTVLEFVVVNLK